MPNDNEQDLQGMDAQANQPETNQQQQNTETPPKPKAKRKPKTERTADSTTSDGLGELQKLLDEVARLQKENKEMSDRYLRMLAEYDNYRKRTAAEAERQKLVGVTQALTALFPVIDSINRALEVLADDDKAKQGILQIKKQFDVGLEKLGVEQIPALGCEFNPEYHNAVMQEENAEMAGKVVQVFQEGYKYKEFVIRPAMVKVAV